MGNGVSVFETMRDIKFRVWWEKSKSWHPYPRQLAIRTTDGALVTAVSDKLLSEVSKEFVYQQYTGLHDKNGKEIYEGDIVLMFQPNIPEWRMNEDRKIMEVRWDEEYANWYLQRIDKEDPSNPGGRWSLHLVKDMELIGNIYENPEFIKEVEKEV